MNSKGYIKIWDRFTLGTSGSGYIQGCQGFGNGRTAQFDCDQSGNDDIADPSLRARLLRRAQIRAHQNGDCQAASQDPVVIWVDYHFDGRGGASDIVELGRGLGGELMKPARPENLKQMARKHLSAAKELRKQADRFEKESLRLTHLDKSSQSKKQASKKAKKSG